MKIIKQILFGASHSYVEVFSSMYQYRDLKAQLFTESGQVRFLKIRDWVQQAIRTSGAFQMNEALNATAGDVWFAMACVDRLVELGEIEEIAQHDPPGQLRVFVKR